jgi:hypothetical protein
MIIRRYDPSGNITLNLSQTLGKGLSIEKATGIVADDEGNMYVSFNTLLQMGALMGAPINHKYILVKFCNQGNLL